jgi:tetratricopeptide (TPR) repeat protein
VLVGRDDIVDELVAAAHHATRGAGAVFVLSGEAGIGKTSVARAVADRVRDELAVTWGKCSADRAAPPFWPWRALVAPPTTASDPLDGAIGTDRFEQLNDLCAEAAALAREQPRLHVVEDVQWADVASVLLLTQLIYAVANAPMLVVATLRTGENLSTQLDDALEDVRNSAQLRVLPPLDDASLAALLTNAGMPADGDTIGLVRGRTGGNPLFVTELLRVARSSGGDGLTNALAGTVPSRVSEVVAHRLARLPEAVADLVTTAAVVGTEGSVATLTAATGSAADAVLDLLEQARAARLMDASEPGSWQFRHALVRDAAYESATGATRARLHIAALEALAADASTPPAVLAHHALAALPIFDADRAVALAARAGEFAQARYGYEEAAAWFERALAAAPAETSALWRAELLALCGEAHRQMGHREQARAAFGRAAELTDEPALVARAALGYADPGADLGIAYRSDVPEPGALLERAIAAQADTDTATMVLLEARLAAELYFSERPDEARALAASAVERGQRLDDPGPLVFAAAVAHDAFIVGQAPMADQLQGSAQLLEWAHAAHGASASLVAHRARVFDLLAAGDLAAVDREIVAFTGIAEQLRSPGYRWWPALWSAMRALLDGNHELAESRAAEAFALGEGPFPTLAFSNFSFLLFFLRREQGRFAEMEQATRDFAASRADIPAIRASLVFLLAETGHLDEARGLLAAIDDATLAQLRDRNWPASWFQLARAAYLTRETNLAAVLLEDRHRPSERCVQVSLATVCLGATDLGTAWLLHTLGDVDGADEMYRAAEDLNGRIGARSWVAQGRADRALLRGSATADEAVFRRSGAVWTVTFAKRNAQIADARGLRDIAYLLEHQGEAVSVLELLDDSAPRASDRGAPALDERARREIRARLHDLDDEIAEAETAGDGERAARARDELQSLAESVARDLGIGGRARRVGDPIERARKTVSTRIRRTIAGIARAHPELGRHLERSIDTGSFCAYRPAEAVDWKT